MGNLSTNFDSSEFRDRQTGECQVVPDLITALEKLRSLVGKPVHINSGYRSPTTNASAGGVGHSQHMEGKAADISVEGLDTFKLYLIADQIEEFQNGGIGVYPGQNFIHVDVRGTRARWARINDQYVGIAKAIEV